MTVLSLAAIAAIFVITLDIEASADIIGQAASTKNLVTGMIGALEQALTTGDKVSANEMVKTGIKSTALLQFLDNSKLNIGASSTVLLDSFIYNPDKSAHNGMVRLTMGALRFASDGHEAKNFAVETPVATLITRGTDFVVICDGVCVTLMASGKLKVCPHPNAPTTRPDRLLNCANSYELDKRFNFTLVGPGGENNGPSRIDPSIVAEVIASIARGDRNPSTTRLAASASAEFGSPPSTENGSGIPFSNGAGQGRPLSPPGVHLRSPRGSR